MNEGSSQSKRWILLIEDEDIVAMMTTAMLEELSYSVIRCSTAESAYLTYRDRFQEIDAVILDMILPDATGKDVFPQLTRINPGINCIIASGYSEDETVQELLASGVKGFIQKPFKLAQLSGCLASVIE